MRSHRRSVAPVLLAGLAAASLVAVVWVRAAAGRMELVSADARGAGGRGGPGGGGRGLAALADPLSAKVFARIGDATEGTLLQGLRDGLEAEAREGEGDAMEERRNMPTQRQIEQERRLVRRQEEREAGRPVVGGRTMNDCGGRNANDCDLALDQQGLDRLLRGALGRPRGAQELLQRSSAAPQGGGGNIRAGFAPGAGGGGQGGQGGDALMARIAGLRKEIGEQKELHRLLRQNADLRSQNAALSRGVAAAAAGGGGGAATHQLSHVNVDESTQGNPPGLREVVPATVTEPPPGPSDFNGAYGVVAHLPHGQGFGPSILNEEGAEQRGSFTVRKANPYEGIVYRVYGRMNHHIACTIRGYRKLSGNFAGNTVYTGYHATWTGKSTLTSGYVPAGGTGEFDVLSCVDKDTGEIQHFRDFPDAPDSSFDHEYPLA